MSTTVSTFYKFVRIADCEELRASLDGWCRSHAIRGTILVAPEGVNGTISGAAPDVTAFLGRLRRDRRFADLSTRDAAAAAHPFRRLKVKVKPEIVAFGVADADPSRRVGTYVAPADWNALIRAPDVVVIDTRNNYECAVGSFEGAIDPGTRTFGEFPAFVREHLDPARHPRVAMFCTGGIRCEKASAYLLSQGFREVYHLAGGILGYLQAVPAEESLWRGDCFVFDERVAVVHGLGPARLGRCASCGQPMRRAHDDGAGPPASSQCEDCSSPR